MSSELRHFLVLDCDEQENAIRRLHKSGMGAYTIAAATRLSVEHVRHILRGGSHEPRAMPVLERA